MKRQFKKVTSQPVKLYFIPDDYFQAYRVWADDNPGDVFLMIPYGEGNDTVHKIVEDLCRYHSHVCVFGDPPENE